TDGRGGAGQGGGLDLLRLLPLALWAPRHGVAGPGQYVGAVPGVAPHAEGAGDAQGRTDRLARDDPEEAPRVRGDERRSGDSSEPDRAHVARGHLLEP